MRVLLFSLIGTGFLFLIALSWRDPGSPPAPSEGATTARAPASTAVASREEIQRLLVAVKSGDSAAGEPLAVALAEHFTNFGADGALARAAVQSPAPLAQAVGLRMLASLPASGESLSALGNGLRNASDPALTEGTMRQLERYLGTTYEADAQRIVEALVGYGERTPAQHAAALVRPFINEHSYEEFRELSARLDSGAEVARKLRAALEEYDRQRHGGYQGL